MSDKTILQLSEDAINSINKLKEKLRVSTTSKMLLDGDNYALREKNKELMDSFNVLEQSYKSKEAEMELKVKAMEDQYKARINTLNAEVAELTLRKANLNADIEVLGMNKLKMLDSVSELKAEKAMSKKTANV